MNVRIGCSGWNYAHWRNGVFYPPRCPSRLWLDYYARFFETVEVNATFYRLPTAKAVQGWVDQSPDNFLFTVKMSRYVTHIKRLRDLTPSMELFYGRLEPSFARRSLGRCFGSSRRRSGATTSDWRRRLRTSRLAATASSFAMRAGSTTTSCSSCVSTVLPS